MFWVEFITDVIPNNFAKKNNLIELETKAGLDG